jgi:hypothetical protein
LDIENSPVTKPLGRFEGRLFAEGGCLFLVVHADEMTREARVTCRIDGQTQVIDMPFDQMARRVGAATGLILDNLSAPATAKRLLQQEDGWYFAAREGHKGPYESKKMAGRELVRYVLCMQTERAATDVPREPRRAEANGRRASDLSARQAAAEAL